MGTHTHAHICRRSPRCPSYSHTLRGVFIRAPVGACRPSSTHLSLFVLVCTHARMKSRVRWRRKNCHQSCSHHGFKLTSPTTKHSSTNSPLAPAPTCLSLSQVLSHSSLKARASITTIAPSRYQWDNRLLIANPSDWYWMHVYRVGGRQLGDELDRHLVTRFPHKRDLSVADLDHAHAPWPGLPMQVRWRVERRQDDAF